MSSLFLKSLESEGLFSPHTLPSNPFRTHFVLEHQVHHQGLANNNKENYLQHFSRNLFQQSIPNLSHDSDRWQSSWHHLTLFLRFVFCCFLFSPLLYLYCSLRSVVRRSVTVNRSFGKTYCVL